MNNFSSAQINSSGTIDDSSIIQPTSSTSNISNAGSDYDSLRDINNWLIVSGNWTLTEEGLVVGSDSNFTTLSNNIILDPLIPENFSSVSTSFKVNSLNSTGANYASIVHSFLDPENYQYAGINILNDNVYAITYKIDNGNVTSEPKWPGIQTNLTWTPDTFFNLSIVDQGNSLDLLINGSTYYSQSVDEVQSNQGYTGLNYDRIQDIEFYNFETRSANQQQSSPGVQNNTIQNVNPVMDTQTILLEGESFPEGSYIHLYDTTPYKITNGHVAAKLPCNDDNSTPVILLVGNAPVLNPMTLEYISDLSITGDLCMYHGSLELSNNDPITDIAIQNNSTEEIEFLDSSSIVISVNEISKIE